MGILEVKNLKLFVEDNQILNDISLNLEKNKIYAIVGPNGAGKSSLAFAIMGLDGYNQYGGDIIFKGKSINNISVSERAERGITLAWQEPARFEGLTVKKFIESAAAEKSDETAKTALEKVGMDPDEYINRAVDNGLSGGERKKVELASILAMEPELVLLDEPDSGIDVASLDRLFEGIKFLKEKGATVVLITHSATAHKQAEYAYLMCQGTIIDEGPIDEIGKYFEESCIPCDHKNAPEQKEGVDIGEGRTVVQSSKD